jgi:hypothetical protein
MKTTCLGLALAAMFAAGCTNMSSRTSSSASRVSTANRPSPRASETPAAPDPFRQYNLDALNEYRAREGVPPLALGASLSDFAQAGSVELSQDHEPHAHFEADSDQILVDGAAAENQGDPDGWPVASKDVAENTRRQIDQILLAMYDEGPGGGHHDTMLSPDYTTLGVGLVTIDGVLYLTNDFTN